MAEEIESSAKSIGVETIRIGLESGSELLRGISAALAHIQSGVEFSNGQVHMSRNGLIETNLQKKKGADTVKISIEDTKNELRMLKKECRNAGVDILIMKRPDNMEDIYDRATKGGNLTAEENEAFKAFTIEDEENPGQRVLMENGYSIEFAASDLDRMEEIARRVTERARSVAERTADSKEKASILAKAREKAMDIAKGIRNSGSRGDAK